MTNPKIQKRVQEYFSSPGNNAVVTQFEDELHDNNYIVHLKNKKYFLRKYKENRTKEDILFEHDFIKFLKKHKVPVAQPIKFQNREIFNFFGGVYSLFEFLDGEQKNPTNLTIIEKDSFIKILVEMHKVSISYKPKFSKDRKDLFVFNFDDYVVRKYSNSKKIIRIQKELKKIKKFLNLNQRISTFCIHNDLSLVNILFKNQKVCGIMDFDDCCVGARISDLINALFDLGFTDAVHTKEILYFLEKYDSLNQLSGMEIQLIGPLLQHRLINYLLFLFYYFETTRKKYYYQQFLNYQEIMSKFMNKVVFSFKGYEIGF